MYLAICSDKKEAELHLLSNSAVIDSKKWQADRALAKDLLKVLNEFLEKNKLDFKDLTGLIVISGPGSFTGLRIGITVANTLAYALNIPIVGIERCDDWLEVAAQRLQNDMNDRIVLPNYGAPAHITPSKK